MAFPVARVREQSSGWSGVRLRFGSKARELVGRGCEPVDERPAKTWSGAIEVVPGVRAFVGATEIAETGETWAKVEFNPSRVLDPDGTSLCPPGQVVELTTAVVDRVLGELVDGDAFGERTPLRRLDVARDFDGVEQPGFFVRGLLPVPRPWSRKCNVYNDAARGHAQTLLVGSKSGTVRLYDKYAEAAKRGAAPGTLRWETEAHEGWLQRLGSLDTVGCVTNDSVSGLAGNRWEWSAMGSEVTATDRVVEKVLRSELSPVLQRGFLGHLLLQSRGVALPLATNTAAKYNRLQRDLNIVLAPGAFDAGRGSGFVARLDWETGREVCRVA